MSTEPAAPVQAPVERPPFQDRSAVFIGGKWIADGDRAPIDVIDATTEEPIGRVPSVLASTIHRAVDAARQALPGWSSTSAEQRAACLARMHEELTARSELIAGLIAAEVGTPIKLARGIQAGLPLTVLQSYIDLLASYGFEQTVGNSRVVREPVGVVAAISPWNYPLHQAMAKVAAALAGGNSVVLKPSSLAPLSCFVLADAAEAAGLPAGTLNVISGPGAAVGGALAAHPDVDMISFTGSTEAGVDVSTAAARQVKRVALELGGKSANVVLPDADLARAVSTGVSNAFLNSGQTCAAWTRMIVPEALLDEALDLAGQAVDRLPPGDPFDPSRRLGPLVSREQVERVRAHVGGAIESGARVVVGGSTPPDDLPRGFFFRPTVLADVTPDMAIAREEVFGPVLVVMPYADEEGALAIANATDYGLAGAVWSADPERATAFARRMRTGQVDINGGRFNPIAPFGGYRKSGIGRELGEHGLEEFLEIKSLQF